MLIYTHLITTIFFILVFIENVSPEDKLPFILIALVATYIPDVDSRFSKIGHRKMFRPLQWFVKHRGIFHSFSFLLAISILLYYFYPITLLPFVLGYGLHLVLDGLTKQGIQPIYPFSWKVKGVIKTGGIIETTLFVLLLLGSLGLFLRMIYSVF